MRKIHFDCNGNNAPAYGCNEPGDNSGHYYQSTDVDGALLELIAEWEAEHDFLNNPHDDSSDRQVGQAYKRCADRVRVLVGDVPRVRGAEQTCSCDTVKRLVMPYGTLLGLCDSDGNEFYVGAIVRRKTEINEEVHGSWVDYEIKLQATTPILSYFTSEKGQVLPVGYTAGCLCNEYDLKMFVFATDPMVLRPGDELKIQEE